MRSRIKLLKYTTIALLGIITVRLFFIQIIEHDSWVAKASEQHTIEKTINAKRGEIYMMDHGEPVAIVMNQTVQQIIIDPTITPQDAIEQALNTYAADYTVVDFDEVYSDEGAPYCSIQYCIVARDVPYTAASQVAEQGIDGVRFQENFIRAYPEGELASTVLGFVGHIQEEDADGKLVDRRIGQYGIEGSLNHILTGTDGQLRTIADVNKIALSIGSDNIKTPAVDGQSVVLTIDRGLERGIEERIATALDNTEADHAAVLVMDPNSGEVVAMTSLPNYDPADYGNVKDASAYLNQVTEVAYEPASTCKSFSYAAAINEGKMTPYTTYFNEHYVYVDGWKISNASTNGSLYGTIDMRTALRWSLNTASIYALTLLGDEPYIINQKGRETLYDYYYNKYRFGHATGIELAEAEGYVQDPNEGYGRDSVYANMTFGQNIGITMIQATTAFSAVVNGGYYRTPTIIKGTLEPDGSIAPLDLGIDHIEDQILTEDTSVAMRDLLINNRATRAQNGIDRAGYAVGGKTGTAQVVVNGAYDDSFSELVGSYLGFVGPSGEPPHYVVMVKMWGEGKGISSTDANDLFDVLENYLIDYMKIKPGGV